MRVFAGAFTCPAQSSLGRLRWVIPIAISFKFAPPQLTTEVVTAWAMRGSFTAPRSLPCQGIDCLLKNGDEL